MSQNHQRGLNKSFLLMGLTFIAVIVFVHGPTQETSWSVLPASVAIFLAFLSGSLSLSLGSAVLLGSFISHYGREQNIVDGTIGMVTTSSKYIIGAGTDTTNLQILGFVFFVLSMVQVMNASGGLIALVGWLKRWVKGQRSAQIVTTILGCVIFIDDYANTMIVGPTMKKVTDRYRVSREKLAFIVDATSAPVAGIALVSTWIGYEVGLFTEMSEKYSWSIDGYAIFLSVVQFRFYCYFMIFFVFVNGFFNVDYGPMKDYNQSPLHPEDDIAEDGERGHLICSFLPLGILLFLVFALLWCDGGGLMEGRKLWSLTDWREVLTVAKNGISILLISSMVSYAMSLILAVFVARLNGKVLWESFLSGVKSSWLPIMILLLAWSLKLICDDLKTGEYLTSILVDKVSKNWLPAGVFLVAGITAFSTGTSWGTMAILIPTVTPVAIAVGGATEFNTFLALCLGAILDGAILGDHCSPISDTTIMSSISTDCDLLNHVKTQMPYSVTVAILALLFGYIPMGFAFPWALTMALGMSSIVLIFYVVKQMQRRQRRNA